MKRNILTIITIITIISIFIIYKTNNENIPITVESTVEYLCSDKIKDREYNKIGNEEATKYIDKLYNQLNLEFIYDNSYLDTFFYEGKSISNIVGKVSGKDNTTAIVITAHFDAWFNGAVDNASGVAAVIELAKNLKIMQQEKKIPNYDIIFLMTNGEMAGFVGSENFVSKIPSIKYKNMYNINIDCIGIKDIYNSNGLALKNLSRIPESEILYNTLKDFLSMNKIEYTNEFPTEKAKLMYEQGYGVSDYISFEKQGYPNLHICQQGVSEFILNENDNPNLLDYEKIEHLAFNLSIYLMNCTLN